LTFSACSKQQKVAAAFSAMSPQSNFYRYYLSCSTTGAVLGGGRPVFSGSSALGANKAPVVNLSSDSMQNGKAANTLQSNAQGMSSGGYAGDDSKVRWPRAFAPCLLCMNNSCFLKNCSGRR